MGELVQMAKSSSFLLWAVTTIAVYRTSASETTMLDIHNYFPNTTHTYRQFACSKQEQECFKEDKLLYVGDGKCYSPGERGPCAEGQMFRADKAEASRRGGHLRGTCDNPCPGVNHAPLAATGQCMSRSDVQTKICRTELYLRPAMDVFGQWVCEWTTLVCEPRGNSFGSFSGQYSTYNGICSAPAVFRKLIDGGENATVPLEKPADHPLLEYFFNKTILEGDFLCTEQEKECLRYGRLLSSDGKCYSLNGWNMRCEPTESFHLDLNEATKENRRLVGTCRSKCKNYKHHHIKTGQCVDYMEFSNQCRYEWGMQPHVDVFGRLTCTCLWPAIYSPRPPALPQLDLANGNCAAPDFENPVRPPSYDETLILGFRVPCSEEEFVCFQKGKVLAKGACHALRTRGPCAENEQLVLDKEALGNAQLKSICTSNSCEEGKVRQPFGDTCLTIEEAIVLFCPSQKIALDEFGGWQCDFRTDNWPGNLTKIVRHSSDGTCELLEKYGHFGGGFAAGAPGAPGGAPGAPGGSFGGGGGAHVGRPAVAIGSGPQGGFQGGHGGFNG